MGRLFNSFNKGVANDFHERLIPQGKYKNALNMVEGTIRNKIAGLSLEPGNETYIDLGPDYYIVGSEYDEGRDWLILFSIKGTSSEIGYISEGAYTKIVSDDEYGCSWGFSKCEKINIEIKYFNNCEEMHLYWTNNGISKVINVIELLHVERRKELNCADFILQKGASEPYIRVQPLRTGGASAAAGTYQVFVRLRDVDGNNTNWSHGSELVKIGSENNKPGEISDEAISINIYPLDNRFDYVDLAIRRTVNGESINQQIYSGQYSDNGFTFLYYGKTGREITLTDEELLEKKNYLFRNYEVHQDKGVLYLYQIEAERVLDYQYKANDIKPYPVFYAVRLADADKFMQLPRDENILPLIAWNYIDGTQSDKFPVTGQEHIDDIEPCGDYPWIKGNDAYVPNGIIPRFKSKPAVNRTSGGSACGIVVNSRDNGGCSGGYCGKAGIPQGQMENSFRTIPMNIYAYAEPDQNEESYVIDAFETVKTEFFPLGYLAPNKDGDVIYTLDENDDTKTYLGLRSSDTGEDSPTEQKYEYTSGEKVYEDVPFKDEDTTDPECDISKAKRACFESADPDCNNCNEDSEDACDPCDDIDNMKSGLTSRAARELARACCPDCTDAEINTVNTVADAMALCNENQNVRYAKRTASLKVTDENVDLDGAEEPDLTLRNRNEDYICYEVTIKGGVGGAGGGEEIEWIINVKESDGLYEINYLVNDDFPSMGNVSGNSIEEVIDNYIDAYNQNMHPAKLIAGITNVEEVECEDDKTDGGYDVVFPDFDPNFKITMEPIYADDDCTIIGYKPYKLGEGQFGKFYSQYKYPKKKDCKGNYEYRDIAGKPIRLFKTPGSDKVPTSFGGYGVVNKYNLDNNIGSETYAILIGLGLKGIVYPNSSELPKPLNPHKPFSIYFANRDEWNSSKITEGILINSFDGLVYGQKRTFFRHGVNGVEKVDRHIADSDNPITLPNGLQIASRLGVQTMSEKPIYGFFSPDTMYNKPNLFNDYVQPYDQLKGGGARLGLFDRGPKINWRLGRSNQKGARSSIFLSSSELLAYNTPYDFEPRDIKGIDYVDADSKANIEGIDQPIVNKKRESIVAMQLDDRIKITPEVPGGDLDADRSFNGYVLDHELMLSGAARRVGIKRVNRQQYGPIEGMKIAKWGDMLDGKGWKYYEFDDNGNPLNLGKGYMTEGLVGDTYVGLFQFVRHSYVSDRVGDYVRNKGDVTGIPDSQVEKKIDIPFTKKDVVFSTDGSVDIFGWIRLMDCGKPPLDGDQFDVRNYNGLRQNSELTPELSSDKFFAGVSNTLISYVAESRINLAKLGIGNVENWEIPVKDVDKRNLTLDTTIGGTNNWRQAFLQYFYGELQEMSFLQKLLRVSLHILRTLLPAFIILYIIIGSLAGGIVGIVVGAIIGIIIFLVLKAVIKVVFTDDVIDNMLGLDACKNDEYGGPGDEIIKGFRDNYTYYNWDYSMIDTYFTKGTMPREVSLCDCQEIGNKIVYTNPQVIDSLRDSYRNNNANKYLFLTQDRGKLQRMYSLGNRVIAHTTDGIYVIRDYDGVKYPVPVMADAPEGIYGLKDPNALILTKHGACFIDREERKLYLLTPQLQVNELATDNSQWLFNNLDYCNASGCIDETNTTGYNLGYDPVFDRLLVTKVDGKSSFTFSVSLRRGSGSFGQIVSFHSYIPDKGYIWNRNKMYAIYGSEIMQHNTKLDAFTVFNNEYYGAMIEFVANGYRPEEEYNLEQFTFSDIMLSVSNEEWDKENNTFNKYINHIFDQVIVYNEDQTSGLIKLQKISEDVYDNEDRLSKKEGGAKITKRGKSWYINELKNVVTKQAKGSLFKRDEKCLYEKTPINYDFESLSRFNNNSGNLTGKYLGCIFILDNKEEQSKNIILHHVIVETDKK